MKEINFEETMQKLEQITAELEKGELSLDESVKKFEEGIKLSKECNKILEDSEKRINILINEDGKHYAKLIASFNERKDRIDSNGIFNRLYNK